MDFGARVALTNCTGSVVSDTSSLLDPDLIDRLDLFEAQFETLEALEWVWRELTRGEEPSGLEALREREFLTVRTGRPN